MATAYVVTPFLELRRSAQSNNYTMTAAWQEVYAESAESAFIFGGSNINLTNMEAGDVVDVRVRYRLQLGGTDVNEDLMTYNGVQPASNKIAHVGVNCTVYGVDISMRQTAGTLRSLYCEFYDAKRRGI